MPKYTYHDVKTGEFVSEAYAEINPAGTVRIEARPNLHLATPMELLQEFSKRAIQESRRHQGWLVALPEED